MGCSVPDTISGPKVAEGAPSKARRYLTEGRLRITGHAHGYVTATCRGDGTTYDLGFNSRYWYCDCPARSDQCAHLRALRLVVDRPST